MFDLCDYSWQSVWGILVLILVTGIQRPSSPRLLFKALSYTTTGILILLLINYWWDINHCSNIYIPVDITNHTFSGPLDDSSPLLGNITDITFALVSICLALRNIEFENQKVVILWRILLVSSCLVPLVYSLVINPSGWSDIILGLLLGSADALVIHSLNEDVD